METDQRLRELAGGTIKSEPLTAGANWIAFFFVPRRSKYAWAAERDLTSRRAELAASLRAKEL